MVQIHLAPQVTSAVCRLRDVEVRQLNSRRGLFSGRANFVGGAAIRSLKSDCVSFGCEGTKWGRSILLMNVLLFCCLFLVNLSSDAATHDREATHSLQGYIKKFNQQITLILRKESAAQKDLTGGRLRPVLHV